MRLTASAMCLALVWVDPLRAQGAPNEHWIITRIPPAERLAAGTEPRSFHVEFSWKGDSVIGGLKGMGPFAGVVAGDRIEARWAFALADTLRPLQLTGRRVGRDSMAGTWTTGTAPIGTWSARRVSTRTARSFEFRPARWYTAYSSTNAPELRVVPGDTIMRRGETVGSGIIPAPIFVEGALPGDLLAVRILRIRPTSLSAWSQRNLILDWFTTDFAREARPPAGTSWPWTLDTIAGVARLDTSCARCRGPDLLRMKDLRIPLRPMVGNIGVAPPWREAHPSPDEGNYGGNLDYTWLREGTTLYLPVYHDGALLSVASDMHAAQGDGELAGTGIEMQADVDIVVNVIRSANVTAIRAEDDRYRMAFGVSADLSRALRDANTNLAEWLTADFNLNQQLLAMILGTAVELDIANVWGRQTTVVAKIRKDLLARIR